MTAGNVALALALALTGGGARGSARAAEPNPGVPDGVEPGAAPAPTRRVALDFRACSAVQEAAIRRIIGIELGELLIGAGQSTPPDGDRLFITCAADRVRVEAGRWQRIERTFRLADFPGDAAPRALALAAIEALAALGPEVRERVPAPSSPAASHPSATATVTAVQAEPSDEAAPGQPSLRITVDGVRRTFLTQHGLSAWGGKVDLDRDLGARGTLGLDVEVAGAQDQVALGQASGLLTSAGAFIGLRAGGRDLTGLLALGGRIGFARLSGDPTPGTDTVGLSVLRPWGGPALAARLLGGWGHLAFDLSAEAGVALFGAEGLSAGDTVLEARGAWLALSAGVGFRY